MRKFPLTSLWRRGQAVAAEILAQQEHRPWPLPDRPWFMFQSWQDLLFAHWPVPALEIEKLLPSGLTLDRYAGEAWVTVVPFRMSGVRQRFTPAAPWVSSFPELNVRTYVKSSGGGEPRPGVYFFSLDAGNPLAVAMARRSYHLPYFRAQMACRVEDGGIRYSSRRTHRGAPEADFRAVYRPTGPVYRAAADSLEQWLIERYCLYSVDRSGRVYRGEIHHRPWPLQPAEAEFERNWLAQAHGIFLPDREPLLHFARKLDVLAWRIEEVVE
ncbi:MAG: DUF2071 domain-containing protein [Caldilineaceae bacterium]|nr:DUF2071 domain-containing protein [Caldilineaceae bacterium]MDE0465273.1 DUF2071 domain-containing protein [Caldilineaceae bacterium]